MLTQFRHHYPQGSLISELIDIDRGLYLVKVSVAVEGVVLATGLAGENTIELAEDAARERAIAALVLDKGRVGDTETRKQGGQGDKGDWETALKDTAAPSGRADLSGRASQAHKQ